MQRLLRTIVVLIPFRVGSQTQLSGSVIWGAMRSVFRASLGASRLCGINAAGHRIEDGRFRLFNNSDGVVDRKTGFPLKPIGLAFRAP
jgi:hypothetical protein